MPAFEGSLSEQQVYGFVAHVNYVAELEENELNALVAYISWKDVSPAIGYVLSPQPSEAEP